MRQEIRLSADNRAAALEVIAWIARPHRAEQTVALLQDWLGRSEKPSRINPKMARLEGDLLRAIKAASWLQSAILAKGSERLPVMDSYKRSFRQMAADGSQYEQHEDSIGNEIRNVWSRRKPVAHLALAVGNEIGRLNNEQGVEGFDWRLVIGSPDWVVPALKQAEQWARSAQALEIVPAEGLTHFMR